MAVYRNAVIITTLNEIFPHILRDSLHYNLPAVVLVFEADEIESGMASSILELSHINGSVFSLD